MTFSASITRTYELVGGKAALERSDNLKLPSRPKVKAARQWVERDYEWRAFADHLKEQAANLPDPDEPA